MPTFKVTLYALRHQVVRRSVNVDADNAAHAVARAERGKGAIVTEDVVRETTDTRRSQVEFQLDYVPPAKAVKLK